MNRSSPKTSTKAWLLATTLACAPLFAINAQADSSNSDEPEVLGFVEWLVLKDPELRMKARLDTGALTSSLHAVNIEPFEKDGQEWIRFEIPLDDHHDLDDTEKAGDGDEVNVALTFERPVKRIVGIKRKNAETQDRYVVDMEFCIAGSMHEAEFSLTDRHNFRYPALLGRRYMRDDNVAVDSSQGFLAQQECDYAELNEVVADHIE
ncbi:ATP-dependent zinc protease [uncultured Marinobacter sp.]|uniref:ATP-dependent zinc protease family protein n=1 Tax=uncultured Marinobacter sp. TaxID=187379 RepID=UPI0030D78E89